VARVTVAISLGSNLGDREAHLAFARHQLALNFTDFRMSSIVETAPVDAVGDAIAGTPPFLNAAAVGDTDAPAEAVLRSLQGFEQARGRLRPYPNAPRTLDLDLVLYGSHIIDEPQLVVPHPRFRTRRFVLEPLAEIAAELIDPVTGLSVGQLLART
jgi:2-amino-4-hydroxy-6-hydroxymethyldihydropteridine diphosphokinase